MLTNIINKYELEFLEFICYVLNLDTLFLSIVNMPYIILYIIFTLDYQLQLHKEHIILLHLCMLLLCLIPRNLKHKNVANHCHDS